MAFVDEATSAKSTKASIVVAVASTLDVFVTSLTLCTATPRGSSILSLNRELSIRHSQSPYTKTWSSRGYCVRYRVLSYLPKGIGVTHDSQRRQRLQGRADKLGRQKASGLDAGLRCIVFSFPTVESA